MTRASRPTIGFLTANVHIGAARALWPGVLDASASADVDLVCFPGGRLHALDELESQRNVLYDLINPQRLDGLLSWPSTLAGRVAPDEVVAFHSKFQPLPIVSLASPVGQAAMVTIDSGPGMRALVSHLVDVHGYTRIALVRGPEGHPYASERYQVFLGALQAKGIREDPALVSPAVAWERGSEAMQVLLDERHLRPGEDFQAVVATSDLLAIGALNILTQRGIRLPDDVAVVGFNDIEEGRLVRPPLTSVSPPFYEQGRRSVEILVDSLTGGEQPSPVVLESRLLVRQSCGCPSSSVNQAAVTGRAAGALDRALAMTRARERLAEQMAVVARGKTPPGSGPTSSSPPWARI